ncbi:hypothetical protein CK203_083221 [Vitis vinifera]|uniref:Uncharacterized protein n=1 Tax=Vitis vinifera TaxID=29760 RepID=A0A438D3V5_VITVI|nr:hypothetical protein CK203_083221 [Vitis vinifera]
MTAPPPPPSRLDLRTTTQLLKRTASSFSSTPFTFLLLSLLLFSFRTVVEDGTLILTAFIDRDPSLRALLSRLDIAGKNIPATLSSPPTVNPRHRRRPFLHLTRVGTLDDDFFSGDEYDDRTLFGGGRRTQINGSFLSLSRFDPKLGFSGSVEDNGIRASEIVRSGFSFKGEGLLFTDGNDDDGDEGNQTVVLENKEERGDFPFFIKGMDLGSRDSAALFFLVCFLSAAYAGTTSFIGTVWDGSRLGLRRLSGFILMRWAVRDGMTQLLGLWFFGEIEDQYSFFKLFVRQDVELLVQKEGGLGGESWKVLLKALDDDIPFQLSGTSLAGFNSLPLFREVTNNVLNLVITGFVHFDLKALPSHISRKNIPATLASSPFSIDHHHLQFYQSWSDWGFSFKTESMSFMNGRLITVITEILAIKELRVRKNGSLERSCVCIAVGKEIRSLVCSNLRWYRLGMKMSHAASNIFSGYSDVGTGKGISFANAVEGQSRMAVAYALKKMEALKCCLVI